MRALCTRHMLNIKTRDKGERNEQASKRADAMPESSNHTRERERWRTQRRDRRFTYSVIWSDLWSVNESVYKRRGRKANRKCFKTSASERCARHASTSLQYTSHKRQKETNAWEYGTEFWALFSQAWEPTESQKNKNKKKLVSLRKPDTLKKATRTEEKSPQQAHRSAHTERAMGPPNMKRGRSGLQIQSRIQSESNATTKYEARTTRSL